MNIRKLFMSALVLTMTLATATCFAMIPRSELNIGGVYMGMSLSDLINMFGQPIKKEPRPPKGYLYVFQNGNTTFIVIPENGHIVTHAAFSNGSMATKAGITIGSTLADVKAVYGEPDDTIHIEPNATYNINKSSIWLRYSAGVERYDECLLELEVDSATGRVSTMMFTTVPVIGGETIGKGKVPSSVNSSRPQH